MAKVRNLKYNNGIVEQPIFNGVNLKKWIHDGIIVWQNGGGDLKDIHVIQGYINDDDYCFVDANTKEIKALFKSSVTIGMCDTFLWRSPYGDKYYVDILTDYDKQETRIDTIDKITALLGNENKILFFSSNSSGQLSGDTFYIGQIDAENSTLEIIDEYNASELSDLPTNVMLMRTSKVCCGYADSTNLVYTCSKTHQEQDLDYGTTNANHTYYVLVKSDKTVHVLADGVIKSTQSGLRLSSINFYFAKTFYTNNQRILMGYKETYNSDTKKTSYVTDYILIDGDNSQGYNAVEYDTSNRDYSSTYLIKYDSSFDGYLTYRYVNNYSRLFKVDKEFNPIGSFDLPDYIDFNIEGMFQYLSYTHLRLAFKPCSAPSGYLVRDGGFAYLNAYDSYYDSDGNIQEDNTLHFIVNIFSGSSFRYDALIYIDNLYCQESEGNFLIPI